MEALGQELGQNQSEIAALQQADKEEFDSQKKYEEISPPETTTTSQSTPSQTTTETTSQSNPSQTTTETTTLQANPSQTTTETTTTPSQTTTETTTTSSQSTKIIASPSTEASQQIPHSPELRTTPNRAEIKQAEVQHQSHPSTVEIHSKPQKKVTDEDKALERLFDSLRRMDTRKKDVLAGDLAGTKNPTLHLRNQNLSFS